MKHFRFPVSCGLAVAAAFLWGMPAAVAVGALSAEAEESPVQPQAVPLDGDIVFQEVVIGPGGVAAGDEGRLIYSNTLGIQAINFPAGSPVSDDISTTAPDGCNLRSFKFKVLGKVVPTGPSGPFTVNYALYSNCPLATGTTNAQRDLVKIPGTDGVIPFNDDAPRAIKHVVDPHNPVAIPSNVYLGLRFNRGNCGTVVGTPAMVGFSADQWDYPGFPCYGFLGGFPQLPHASFWLEMYGDVNCPTAFPGYKNAQASGPIATLGANVQGVDDIKLQVENCQMVGYEVAVRGVGFYTFDLRRQCDGQIISGTERTYQISASTTPQLQIARFKFDPPIPLLDDDLFLGFRTSSNSSGAVIAGKVSPVIGESSGDYFKLGLDGCEPVVRASGVHGAIHLGITCAGTLPAGACCDMVILECEGGADSGKRCLGNSDCGKGTCEPVCRELSEMNCAWPIPGYGGHPKWVEGGQCKTDPFEMPCGVAACCKPDDTCENLTKNECNSVPPLENARLWQRGEYCGQGSQACPFSACLDRVGPCMLIHDGVGCSDPLCCSYVCARDPWCCLVEWDRLCVDYAGELCGSALNDSCSMTSMWDQGAIDLTQNTLFRGNNLGATESLEDIGFCCNGDAPGTPGFGSVWFKFVATEESAQIDTCFSDAEGDTLVNVFSATDQSSQNASCASLELIACADDGGCDSEQHAGEQVTHSRFCVDGLIVGHTYYIMFASKTEEAKSQYQIQMTFPCQYLTPFPADDCNSNGALDGCDLSDQSSADCNLNSTPDECEIADGIEQDCNDNSVPDLCDIGSGVALDCQPNRVPDECEVAAGFDCDEDGVPDDCDPFRMKIQANPPNKTFGRFIVSEGEQLFVWDRGFSSAGIIEVYRRGGGSWSKVQTLMQTPSTPGDDFGTAFAVSGDWLFALSGSPQLEDATIAGDVHIFHREGEAWQDVGKLADPSELSAYFGWCALAVKEGVLLASACDYCVGQLCGPSSGREKVINYIYELHVGTWTQVARIESEYDATAGYDFVGDVGRDFVVIGLQEGDPYYYEADASVRVFRKVGGGWIEGGKLVLPHSAKSQIFGRSIQIRDNLLLATVNSGSSYAYGRLLAYLYRREHGMWILESTLSPPDLQDGGNSTKAHILRDDTIAFAFFSQALGTVRSELFSRHPEGAWVFATTLDLSPGPSWGRGNVGLAGGPDYLAMSVSDWEGAEIGGSVNLYSMPLLDCNRNEVSDGCEWTAGCDGTFGVPECIAKRWGDGDANGAVDLRDFAGLQRCFARSGSPLAACCGIFDAQPRDGDADLVDFAAFVGAMTGP